MNLIESLEFELTDLYTGNYNRNDVPKTIWFFWMQGINEDTPEVVKLSLKSWIKFNPDYEVKIVTADNIDEICPLMKFLENCHIDIKMALKSDFLRTYLLVRYGGIWVDATTFCWKPLNTWLEVSVKQTKLFFFLQPDDVKDRQIKSWFIASAKNHPILVKVIQNLSKYLCKARDEKLSLLPMQMQERKFNEFPDLVGREKTGAAFIDQMEIQGFYPYFVYFYIFNDSVKDNPTIKSLWKEVCLLDKTRSKGLELVSKQSYHSRWMERNGQLYSHRKQLLAHAMSKVE